MTTRVVNVRAETYDVYIGRKKGGSIYDTGDWGNPCVIGKDGTREEVIEKYRVHLKEQVRLGLSARGSNSGSCMERVLVAIVVLIPVTEM